MRTTLGALVLLSACSSACVTSGVGPGVLREDWAEPRRDPDPTRNPTEELRGNPFQPEAVEHVAPPGASAPPAAPPDGRVVDLAKRGAATFLAWAVAGWIPLIEWSGTFEEDPAQRAKLRARAHDPAR